MCGEKKAVSKITKHVKNKGQPGSPAARQTANPASYSGIQNTISTRINVRWWSSTCYYIYNLPGVAVRERHFIFSSVSPEISLPTMVKMTVISSGMSKNSTASIMSGI